MKKILIVVLLLCVPAGMLFCDITEKIKEADALYKSFKYNNAFTLLLSIADQASGNKEKAEVYWRLARAILYLGNEAEDAKEPKSKILTFFEKGEAYADTAIEADPENYLGYYWKSSNAGRWGQIKGILNALFKADPMRKLLVKALSINPDHPDSFYVLGELYDELNGVPFTFGNIDFAVSLGRKAVALHEKTVASGKEPKKLYWFYIKEAKHLYKRNFSAAKRTEALDKKKKSYDKEETGILEKNCYYEGTLTLKNMSDREEAREIANTILAELEALPARDKQEQDDLKDLKEMMAGWK
jgi:tetratricopeptide (TPR) repeat protein